MSDLLFQNITPTQSKQQPYPVTLASAATVAITTFLTFITGTVQIATITPPVTGTHVLCLIFTDVSPGTLLTSGNIASAVEPTQNVPVFLVYDPVTAKYYGGEVKIT